MRKDIAIFEMEKMLQKCEKIRYEHVRYFLEKML